MTETRQNADGTWRTREVIDVKYSGWDGLKTAIADAEQRLSDPSFNVGTEYEYGDCVAYANIEGWRAATPEEIIAGQAELAKAAANQKRWDEQQLEQLRQRYPEQFK